MCPDLSGQKAPGTGEDLMFEEQHRPWGSASEDSSNEERRACVSAPLINVARYLSYHFFFPVMHHFSLFVLELKPSVVFLF